MVLMQRLINSFGVDTISAITAAMKLESFAMVPIMMFYMGLSNFTGQNMGAGKLDRIKRGYHQTMVMAMITCAGIILLLIFAGPYAIGLFHMNKAATAIGSEYLRTLAWFFLIFCVMYITNGVLQGSGDVAYPTAGSMTSLIVRVIVANIMATFPASAIAAFSIPSPSAGSAARRLCLSAISPGSGRRRVLSAPAHKMQRRKPPMADIIAAISTALAPSGIGRDPALRRQLRPDCRRNSHPGTRKAAAGSRPPEALPLRSP